jgi:AcrR family transcriptional regulator
MSLPHRQRVVRTATVAARVPHRRQRSHSPAPVDRETRERLISVATQLFAEHGFSKVTVRDICQKARANVAAINYHFGGKEGLYHEILQSAIAVMQGTTQAAKDAGTNRRPEEQFEAYIRIFLERIVPARESWIHQLMVREISDPTPALQMIFEQVMSPRIAYLAGIIARILDCPDSDPRVSRCLMSVNAQMLVLLDSPIASRFRPTPPVQKDDIPAMIRHITCFSLAGIRAIAAT